MHFVHAGAAVLLLDPRFNGAPHLWAILTDPDPLFADGKVVAVSFVTARGHTDSTTVLNVGDHAFVRHATHVDYGGAKLFRVPALEHERDTGRCHPQEDLPQVVLDRLREGLLRSARTPNFMIEICTPLFKPERPEQALDD